MNATFVQKIYTGSVEPRVNKPIVSLSLNKKNTREYCRYKSHSIIHASPSPSEESANKDFDVEDYDYEPEQYATSKTSSSKTSSIIPEPMKKYYLPLTDVPYLGDVDSTYDVKK